MDAEKLQRREGRRDARHHHHHPPTTTTTPLHTSTGDHASHLHHQNPTPALPTAGDRNHHQRPQPPPASGSPTLLPTKEWEITAASEKLAECQETILNLGKQLKALAAPKDSALLDNLVSNPSDNFSTTTPKKSINQRSSLLDKMLAEDNARNTMEVFSISGLKTPPAVRHGNSGSSLHPHGKEDPPERFLYRIGSKCNGNEDEHGSLAITPVKK